MKRRPRSSSRRRALASAPVGVRTSRGLECRHAAPVPPSGTPPSACAAPKRLLQKLGRTYHLIGFASTLACLGRGGVVLPRPSPRPLPRLRGGGGLFATSARWGGLPL